MFGKVKTFIKESKTEFEKVDWPSRSDTVYYTSFVIGVSLLLAVYLGGLDYVLVKGLGFIL